jgi:hypothetical protein
MNFSACQVIHDWKKYYGKTEDLARVNGIFDGYTPYLTRLDNPPQPAIESAPADRNNLLWR